MSSFLVHFGIWFGVALVLLVGIVSIIHSLIVSHRLQVLANSVIVHDPDTFRCVQVITCEGCHSKRHVSLYGYGSESVYLCYLCMPRLERALEQRGYGSSGTQSGSSQRKGQA